MKTGSSPLTRGKLRGSFSPGISLRLIPAHAGKTRTDSADNERRPAHPRSRGENGRRLVMSSVPPGSSPLTRGKRLLNTERARDSRLIPAHAGKTAGIVFAWDFAAAHPRSRGENANRFSRQ